jgi:DNA-binding transcriptional MerR regulator
MYRIGDFAKLTQIPIKTLRYYDEIGLLRPANVNRATGYRYYTATQFEHLNRILVFRDLGFALGEIRELIAENVPPDQLRDMLHRKQEEVERRLRDERARLARVAARVDLIEQFGRGGSNDVAVRRVGAQFVASIRDTLRSYDEAERLFDELDGRLGRSHGVSLRAAVWRSCGSAPVIDCEAAVFLDGPIAPVEGLATYEMPEHTIACLVYHGEEDYKSAFGALASWIRSTGAGVAGPKREVFLHDGRDGRESVTEIQYPIVLDPGSDILN